MLSCYCFFNFDLFCINRGIPTPKSSWQNSGLCIFENFLGNLIKDLKPEISACGLQMGEGWREAFEKVERAGEKISSFLVGSTQSQNCWDMMKISKGKPQWPGGLISMQLSCKDTSIIPTSDLSPRTWNTYGGH